MNTTNSQAGDILMVSVPQGGEMIYILDQRLHAQMVAEDKSHKGKKMLSATRLCHFEPSVYKMRTRSSAGSRNII